MPLFLEIDMTSSVHVDNKNKNVLILGKGLREGLGNTTIKQQKQNILLIFQDHKESFVKVFIIMGAVFYLLTPQESRNSKEKTLK